MTVWDNVKELKAWILGAIAFDAAVTSLLVAVFGVDAVKTTIATTATTIVALAIIFLIYKSEARSRKELQKHIDDSNTLVTDLKNDMTEIKKMILENGKSTLRIEINEEMLQNPHNQDTILKMAERYFSPPMKGDWYMTNRFLDWAEKEKVHLPPSLIGLKRD